MDYTLAAAWLDQRQIFTIKPGLATTRALLAELGNPQERLRCIHIAGTNGKGSVAAMLQAMLAAAGHRTGLYASPHLSSVRERFSINGRLIPKADFARLVTRLDEVIRDRFAPTYFECATLIALLWFAEQKTRAVILETGMGGRLDATNVVSPELVIITDISRDHEQYLGTSLRAIAAEKAGIIKPGRPVIFSGKATKALPVIEDRCRELGCPLFLTGRHYDAFRDPDGQIRYRTLGGNEIGPMPLALQGAHQTGNAALALAAIELLAPLLPVTVEQIQRGLQETRWPGRLELLTEAQTGNKVRILLDGAHNEAGVMALSAALAAGYPRGRLFLLWGAMADKDMGSALEHLLKQADVVMLTRAAEALRAAEPEALRASLPPNLRAEVHCLADSKAALTRLLAMADQQDDLICVAGSLYLVGRIRSLLVGEPQ
ncbi:MAG: bifunctional folylpolyglutamate synthase/dihydrofolate synthase [Desulfobulbus sp.]|jgi:dihydrofolate synthase/folylpolyglutamate synthase